MPRRTEKDMLKELILMLGVSSIYCPQLVQGLNITMHDSLLFLAMLQFCRYLGGRTPVAKNVNPMDSFFSDSESGRKYFRSQLRMNRAAFISLFELIKGHPVFKESQEPIPLQLAVTLFRLGVVGNASPKALVAAKFGISPGSVHNYTERVICAINSLASFYITWPLKDERAKISIRLAKASLPKCLGFIGRVEAVLIFAPTEDRESYWSKRNQFSMQFQIVCDPDQQIRSLFTGYPGSAPNTRVYRNSDPCQKAAIYFGHEEYVIGNSAFPGCDTLVIPYKNHGELSEIEQNFNKHILSEWKCVEHTIGMLKGRFQSLNGIRIAVDGYSGHKRVCEWIQACVVLHNFLIPRDPWVKCSDEIHIESWIDEDDEDDPDVQVVPARDLKRDALCKIVKERLF